jgi:hypothetical protein
VSRDTRRVEIRDAGVDDVREIQNVALTTWDHTYGERILHPLELSTARVESGESNNQVTA